MADTHETIADVVRKIRNEIAELRKVSPNVPSIAADWWEARADEIEAAHKREAGDAAKLREACANIAAYARSAQCHATDAHILGYLSQIEMWACAALAAPPRNCDNVKTSWDVLKKWHEGLDTANAIVRMLDWLLAPATEKEGGNK